MNEMFVSIAQGVLQGLTEYLPVSSSGHLSLVQQFYSSAEPSLSYDLMLHLATVLATMIYFCKDIFRFICDFFAGFRRDSGPLREGWYFGWSVIFGSVPTAVAGLLLKDAVERAAASPVWVGGGLLVTAFVLFLMSFVRIRQKKICISIGFLVGIAQGIAVFPGVSRSGMTLAAGLMAGLSVDEAFRFSFLLSLPAILGASALQLLHADTLAALPVGWECGCAAAFITGLAALFATKRFVMRGQWRAFAMYCALLGLVSLLVTAAKAML